MLVAVTRYCFSTAAGAPCKPRARRSPLTPSQGRSATCVPLDTPTSPLGSRPSVDDRCCLLVPAAIFRAGLLGAPVLTAGPATQLRHLPGRRGDCLGGRWNAALYQHQPDAGVAVQLQVDSLPRLRPSQPAFPAVLWFMVLLRLVMFLRRLLFSRGTGGRIFPQESRQSQRECYNHLPILVVHLPGVPRPPPPPCRYHISQRRRPRRGRHEPLLPPRRGRDGHGARPAHAAGPLGGGPGRDRVRDGKRAREGCHPRGGAVSGGGLDAPRRVRGGAQGAEGFGHACGAGGLRLGVPLLLPDFELCALGSSSFLLWVFT